MTTGCRGLRVRRLDATLTEDEGGQISAVGVMAAAVFACLLLLVINTGFATSGKIEMQNAADATAISGATWVARGLNVISLNNVTSSQILAVIIIIRALDQHALTWAIRTLKVQQKACALLVVGAPVCVAIITAQIVLLQGVQTIVSGVSEIAEDDRLLWQIMDGLEAISGVVRVSFFIAAEVEADRIARQNRADLGFIVPAGFTPWLPVRKGAMRPDLCEPTRRDPLSEFSAALGKGFYLFENSLIRLWFWIWREHHYNALCGGNTGYQREGREVRSLEECRLRGGGTATWGIVIYETISYPSRQPFLSLTGDDDPNLRGKPRGVDPPLRQSCSITPPGTPIGNGTYRARREIVERTGTDAQGNPTYRYRYEFTDYVFLSATVPSNIPSGEPGELPSGEAMDGRPDPYMLEDGAKESLRYLAIVYRKRTGAIAPDYFVTATGKHRLAYGQARVYNPVAFDTFTQEWRVTLEPASLIEDGTLVGALAGPVLKFARISNTAAARDFEQANGFFDELRRELNVLRYVNNH